MLLQSLSEGKIERYVSKHCKLLEENVTFIEPHLLTKQLICSHNL
jgi:hypothetical protein